jgi:hypothetical protein
MTEPGLDQKVTQKRHLTLPFLITGLVLFILGLLSILHQVTLYNILSQVLPDPQAIDFFGIMVQVVGQSLVILSFTKSKSNKEMKGMQAKTQQATECFKEKFKQFQIILHTAISANNSYHANKRFDAFLTVFASSYRWRAA